MIEECKSMFSYAKYLLTGAFKILALFSLFYLSRLLLISWYFFDNVYDEIKFFKYLHYLYLRKRGIQSDQNTTDHRDYLLDSIVIIFMDKRRHITMMIMF